MNPRSTGILLLVAAALGAFVYFYEVRGSEKRLEAAQQAKELFPHVESDAIQSIELQTTDGKAAHIVRREDHWRLIAPLAFPADRVASDAMAADLAKLVRTSTLEKPQPPKVYGLADSAKVIRFDAGGKRYELRVGKKTPLGGDSYVSVGGSTKIYTVPSFRVNSFRRSLADLRDRRPLHFDQASIRGIEASWPGGRVVLDKQEGKWKLVEPLHAKADEETVRTLLSDLAFLRATGFLDEPSAGAKLGLDKPAFHVVLTGEKPKHGKAPHYELAIGNTIENGKSRVVRAAEPSLYEIPADRLDDFPRRVVAYRFKELAHFIAGDAERIELTFQDPSAPSKPTRITAERGPDGWKTRPEAIPSAKVEDLLDTISDLRAKDIAAESMTKAKLASVGLAPPAASLQVFGAVPKGGKQAPKLADIEIGHLDAARGLFARVPARPTIYLLAPDTAKQVPVSLEALRNRFLAKAKKKGKSRSKAPAAAKGRSGAPAPAKSGA